jgi:hypothetical protein
MKEVYGEERKASDWGAGLASPTRCGLLAAMPHNAHADTLAQPDCCGSSASPAWWNGQFSISDIAAGALIAALEYWQMVSAAVACSGKSASRR